MGSICKYRSYDGVVQPSMDTFEHQQRGLKLPAQAKRCVLAQCDPDVPDPHFHEFTALSRGTLEGLDGESRKCWRNMRATRRRVYLRPNPLAQPMQHSLIEWPY